MRILATADIHIWNYTRKASIKGGVSSRLLGFLRLAEILNGISEKKGVDALVVAGDILHAASLTPPVMNVARRFLESLKAPRILVIDGNHDVDIRFARDRNSVEISSALEPLVPDNITYNESVTIGGVEVIAYSYRDLLVDKGALPQPTQDLSVFVSHGVVKGAAVPAGMTFSFGFDPEELAEKYTVSIVGDIHLHQVLNDRVIIPGCPIQHSAADPELTGVVVIDIEENGKVSWEFIPIEDDTFPKFPRTVTKKEVGDLLETQEAAQSELGDVKAMVSSIVDESIKKLKVSDADKRELFSLASQVLDECAQSPKARSVARVELRRLELQNFGCHERLEVDLDSSLAVVGPNGSGKSTVAEAICWVLYGKTSTAGYVDDIVNETSGGNVYVQLDMLINNQPVSIVRVRSHEELGSGVYVNTGNGLVKPKNGDREVENLIGLTYEEFLTAFYHHQEKTGLLSPRSVNTLLGILAMVYDLDVVNSLEIVVSNKLSSEKKRLVELETKIGMVKSLQEASVTLSSEEYGRLRREYEELREQEEDLKKKYRTFEDALYKYSSKADSLRKKIEDLKKSKEEANKAIQKVPGVAECKRCPLISWAYETLERDEKAYESELVALEELIQAAQKAVSDLTSELQRVRDKAWSLKKILDRDRNNREILKKAADTVGSLSELEREYEEVQRRVKLISVLKDNILGKKGLLSIIASTVLNTRLEKVNQKLSDSGVEVRFEPIRTKAGRLKGGVEPIVKIDGKERRYHKLSGGERLLVDLAVLTDLFDLLQEKCVGPDLLIMDEVSRYFDEVNLGITVDILTSIQGKCLVITHQEALASSFPKVLNLGARG